MLTPGVNALNRDEAMRLLQELADVHERLSRLRVGLHRLLDADQDGPGLSLSRPEPQGGPFPAADVPSMNGGGTSAIKSPGPAQPRTERRRGAEKCCHQSAKRHSRGRTRSLDD